MLDFDFYSPTKFYFGRGAENKLPEALKEFKAGKVLIHSGGSSSEKSGLLGRVRDSLKEAGIPYVELPGVVPNPRLSLVREGIELARKEGVDFILSVGGGSAADSAKAISVGVPYKGDVLDFYLGKEAPAEALPLGTVITLAATGTEGSNSSVISFNQDGKEYKRGLNSDLIRPAFSIMNPELTYTVPPYLKAAGVTDIFSHILERYISNTEHVDLSDRMSEAVMQSLLIAAVKAMEQPEDYEAHATIMWAGTVAHNNLLGLGREQDWSSHQIEHELSAAYNATHGAGLAVVQPAFMAYTMKKNVGRYARFASRVMGVPYNPYDEETTAAEGIRRFRAFLDRIGMPNSIRAFGATEADIPELAKSVRRNNGDKVGWFCPLSQADVEEILRLCY